MGQRLIYQWDLLVPERRRRYEQAASRNGLRLSKWLREVVDAAAERAPVPAVPADVVLEEPEPELVLEHVHVPRVLPWGGRQCAECLLLL